LRTKLAPRQLLGRFRQLLPAGLLAGWLGLEPHQFYLRALTPLITLWYLVFQHLNPDHTLGAALADAFAGGADALSPRGKRLSRQLHSQATSSLNDARQRLPLGVLQQALGHTAQQIRSWTQNPGWLGWNVSLLDGSTLRLRPHEDIARQFPPHGGGHHKKSYWCLMRVVVGFCLATGAALGSAQGATSLSEQALAAQFILQTLPETLFVGDRNFGVFSVVQAVRHSRGACLFRLTKVRARKLVRAAGLRLVEGLDTPVTWTATAHDQCQEGYSREPVAGRLLVVRVRRPSHRSQVLYLFTTLTDRQTYSLEALVRLYAARWHIELNLRYVKQQLELGALECKSAEMAQKEWLAGLLAYNLIRAVMVAAAAQAQVPVTLLSFSRTRQLFLRWLIRWGWQTHANAQSWETLLIQAAQCRHPKRPKPRPSEPRAIRYFKQAFPRLSGDRATARKKLTISHAKSLRH
jgi:putative transposase